MDRGEYAFHISNDFFSLGYKTESSNQIGLLLTDMIDQYYD